MNGVPWVSVSHRVSADLEETVAHWLKLSVLSASLCGSGRKNGGLNGNNPSCPADGLCWCGIPLVFCAYPRCNICTDVCGKH